MPRMKLIHGRNWVVSAIAKAADHDPILEMNMDVYYIQWRRDGKKFYMADMSDDGRYMQWTRIQQDGCQFLGEDEAKTYMRKAISAGRRGLDVIEVEIPIQLDLLGDS